MPLPIIGGEKRRDPTGEEILEAVGVPPDKIKDCLDWAFGHLYGDEPPIHLALAWNKRHGDIFVASKGDRVIDLVCAVGKAYCMDVLKTGGDPRVLGDKRKPV